MTSSKSAWIVALPFSVSLCVSTKDYFNVIPPPQSRPLALC